MPTADGGAVQGDRSAAGNNEALAGRGNLSPALWKVTQQQHLSRALTLPVQVLLSPSGVRGGGWRRWWCVRTMGIRETLQTTQRKGGNLV